MSRLNFDESNQIDLPGKFMMLSKFEIRVDESYQRPSRSANEINKIARDFSWKAFGTLSVANRNGRFYCFDGQHRLKAALRNPAILNLPCMVFEVEEIKEEASGFCKMNMMRSPVRSFDHFRAEIVADNPLAISLDNMLSELGIVVCANPRKQNELKCIGSIRQQFKIDPVSTKRALVAALAAGNRDNVYIHESIASGFFYLDSIIDLADGISNPRFLDRVSKVGSMKMIDGIARAKSYYVKGGGKVFAQGIIDTLNHGMHKRFEIKQ